jgi:hypothetical protein
MEFVPVRSGDDDDSHAEDLVGLDGGEEVVGWRGGLEVEGVDPGWDWSDWVGKGWSARIDGESSR